ncbi:hypothetical protein GCM10023208_30510 [Erythrobacter westpacificensis]|uniref:Uncharacterized protein n=1 Tax=Erythrobacter westpacificensis TaxID=1055231 RepID=A0ABP9KR92_9SPHN
MAGSVFMFVAVQNDIYPSFTEGRPQKLEISEICKRLDFLTHRGRSKVMVDRCYPDLRTVFRSGSFIYELPEDLELILGDPSHIVADQAFELFS